MKNQLIELLHIIRIGEYCGLVFLNEFEHGYPLFLGSDLEFRKYYKLIK